MILLVHIIIALTSLLVAGLTYLSPSKKKLRLSYIFVAATIASGTVLLLLKPSHLTQTCMTGLTYLGFVTIGIALARQKLARATEMNQ